MITTVSIIPKREYKISSFYGFTVAMMNLYYFIIIRTYVGKY